LAIWRPCWKKCGLHKLTNKVGCIRTQYNLMAGLISYHSAIFIPQMLPLATMGIKVKTCYLKCINNDRDIVHESKCLVCSIWHKPNTVVKGDIVWLPNFLTLLKFGWPYAWHCFCKTLYKSITTTIINFIFMFITLCLCNACGMFLHYAMNHWTPTHVQSLKVDGL
jgi:hypothetical protein